MGTVYFERKGGKRVSFSTACDKVLSAASLYKRGRNTTFTVMRIFCTKASLLFSNIIYFPCGFSVYCAIRWRYICV